MGLVVAGTLVDYRDAERAPTDVAASLYALLRETEAMHRIWGKPDMAAARARMIAVVTSLRADISSGNTRECEAAIEDLSQTLEELEGSDVPANYIVRLRSEQAALRKAALRVYHIQREEFLPSAKTMIMSIVVIIVLILLFTDMGGLPESLVTVGFLAFFFIYLLRLLNVIDKPFKAGRERTDDDVSLSCSLSSWSMHRRRAPKPCHRKTSRPRQNSSRSGWPRSRRHTPRARWTTRRRPSRRSPYRLTTRKGRSRPRPLRGALLARLAPAREPVHGGFRLSGEIAAWSLWRRRHHGPLSKAAPCATVVLAAATSAASKAAPASEAAPLRHAPLGCEGGRRPRELR
jgi:hypothetical protein